MLFVPFPTRIGLLKSSYSGMGRAAKSQPTLCSELEIADHINSKIVSILSIIIGIFVMVRTPRLKFEGPYPTILMGWNR